MTLTVMALLLFAVPLYAKSPSVDARFDKTGNGLVDAGDWKLMSNKEKRAYARASLRELGLDPKAGVGGGKTRVDSYLKGLRSVYGR